MMVLVCCFSFAVITNAGEKDEKDKQGALKESDSSDWGVHHSARAIMQGTAEDSTVNGRVDFVQTGGGLQMVASVSNVTPAGKHGIHIHEGDSCEDVAKTAGDHFNPVGTAHGLLVRDGHGRAHAGDLGNIEVKADGTGSLVMFLPGLNLIEGHSTVTGRVVVLKEKEDDFSQSQGNAGAGIACGVIILNK
jgi:Cu-Zn family superoxide dismutase